MKAPPCVPVVPLLHSAEVETLPPRVQSQSERRWQPFQLRRTQPVADAAVTLQLSAAAVTQCVWETPSARAAVRRRPLGRAVSALMGRRLRRALSGSVFQLGQSSCGS